MEDNIITIDDFLKVDLRVVKILSAEEVPDSQKLLRLIVDMGNDEKRQIIAGIKKSYKPEELIGRQVVIVSNLKPRKLAGLESQGMIVATHDDQDNIVLIGPEKEVSSGNKLG